MHVVVPYWLRAHLRADPFDLEVSEVIQELWGLHCFSRSFSVVTAETECGYSPQLRFLTASSPRRLQAVSRWRVALDHSVCLRASSFCPGMLQSK